MEKAIVLARFLGPILLIVGLSMAINPRFYREVAEGLFKNPAAFYLRSVLALLLGVLVVLVYHRWEANWTLAITIFGWLALLKGTVGLLIPNAMMSFGKKMKWGNWFIAPMGVLCALWGLYLCGAGFVAY